MPQNTIQTDIYRIEIESILEEIKSQVDEERYATFIESLCQIRNPENELALSDVDTIMLHLINQVIVEQNSSNGLNYSNIQLKNIDGFNYRFVLYKANSTPGNPIVTLLSEHISQGQKRVLKNSNISCVLFAYNTRELFAFCSGAGWQVISKYVDPFFGLQILTRLIPKESPAVRSAHNRGFTGSVAAQSINYRDDAKPSEIVDFGKLCKDLVGRIETRIIREKLGFEINTRKSYVNGIFKNSFRLRKKLNLSQLIEMLNRITNLLDQNDNTFFNLDEWLGLTPLGRSKHDNRIKERLQKKLFDKLLIFATQDRPINFDYFISHPNITAYEIANDFKIKVTNIIDLNYPCTEFSHSENIFLFLRNLCNSLNVEDIERKRELFVEALKCTIIDSFEHFENDRTIQLTRGKFIDHIHGEVYDDISNKSYIIIDGTWYTVYTGLKDRLNNELPSLISNHTSQHNLPEWIQGDEDAYLEELSTNHGFAMLHRKRPLDNIELCDAIKVENGKLCLYHVKDSFDTAMRVLAAQVRSSATLLTDLKKNGRIGELEEKWREYSETIPGLPDWNSIRDAITGTMPIEQRIVICPVHDIINNIQNSQSTIAKYEMAALIKLWTYDMNLGICIL